MGRFFRILGGTFIVIIASILAVTVFVFLEDAPALQAGPAPVPQDVVAVRELVRGLHTSAASDVDDQIPLNATMPQLNSAIRLGERFIPGFRGDVSIRDDMLIGQVSIPVPWWRGNKWVNLSGAVPEFDGALAFDSVRIGSWDLPPKVALSLGRIGANVFVGDSVGDTLTTAASAMRIDGDTVQFDLTLGAIGDNGLMRNISGAVRGQAFPSAEEIEAAYQRIRTAMETGVLPTTGSFLPYLEFTLRDALANTKPGQLPNAYTASVFALTRVCGPDNFNSAVDRLAITSGGSAGNWTTDCGQLTLNGRIDSRRHFIVSGAIRAASNTGISYSIGEFKELHDSVSGAGGFDFTDIAANLSGIRLTNHFMSLPATQWPDAIDRLTTERAVIVGFDGIPTLMPETEFNDLFGTIDSDAYNTMLAMIDARIDELDLFTSDDITAENP